MCTYIISCLTCLVSLYLFLFDVTHHSHSHHLSHSRPQSHAHSHSQSFCLSLSLMVGVSLPLHGPLVLSGSNVPDVAGARSELPVVAFSGPPRDAAIPAESSSWKVQKVLGFPRTQDCNSESSWKRYIFGYCFQYKERPLRRDTRLHALYCTQHRRHASMAGWACHSGTPSRTQQSKSEVMHMLMARVGALRCVSKSLLTNSAPESDQAAHFPLPSPASSAPSRPVTTARQMPRQIGVITRGI